MKQITVRRIPDAVETELRKLAKRRQQSVNKTAVHVLQKGLGIGDHAIEKRDLSRLAGQWSAEDCRLFEQNVSIFETIDESVWQ